MSMMRASGAMPSMTALQRATASLAVPKSVMKTMVAGWATRPTVCVEASSAASLPAGAFAQPATHTAAVRAQTSIRARSAREDWALRDAEFIIAAVYRGIANWREVAIYGMPKRENSRGITEALG